MHLLRDPFLVYGGMTLVVTKLVEPLVLDVPANTNLPFIWEKCSGERFLGDATMVSSSQAAHQRSSVSTSV